MTEEQGYNGWTNYPTWNVALWLDNDQATYEEVRELTLTAIDEHGRRVGYGTATEGSLAHHLKEYVEELTAQIAPQVYEASHVADIFGWAMEQVDWFELAANYLEEVPQDA